MLGPDYAARRGEQFLLARSREQEEKGNKDAAMGCIEVLLRLSPKATLVVATRVERNVRTGRVSPSITAQAAFKTVQ